MQSMNAQMNMPQLQAIMREFEMQSDQLEQKQEMMEDAMDSALDEGDEDEEADGEGCGSPMRVWVGQIEGANTLLRGGCARVHVDGVGC